MTRLGRWTAAALWAAAGVALGPGAAAAGDGGSPAVHAATEWLRPFVKTLSRPIEVYHYAYRPVIRLPAEGPAAADAAFISAYLARKSSRYWDAGGATRPYAMAGGLYAAIDPVIGRTFGGIGDSWALFALSLPAGTRFVDVRGWSDNAGSVQRIPPAARQQLAEAGCRIDFPSQLLVAQESPACRHVALEVMRALDVDGLLYRYQGFEFDGCQGRPVGSFILTRTGRVAHALLLTNDSPGPKAASETHLRVRVLYQEARRLGSLHPVPWPDLEGLAAPADLDRWKQERLFGCGGYSEDRLPGQAQDRLAGPGEGERK